MRVCSQMREMQDVFRPVQGDVLCIKSLLLCMPFSQYPLRLLVHVDIFESLMQMRQRQS